MISVVFVVVVGASSDSASTTGGTGQTGLLTGGDGGAGTGSLTGGTGSLKFLEPNEDGIHSSASGGESSPTTPNHRLMSHTPVLPKSLEPFTFYREADRLSLIHI